MKRRPWHNASVGAPSPHDALEAAASLGIPLEEGAAHRLIELAGLLEGLAVPQGLIASGDAGRVFERHVVDSLRAAAEIRETDRVAYDLGSGAGLPGLVVAIAAPGCRVVLVESRSRRAGFLELAVERLAIDNAEVAATRAEELTDRADVATARAFAPLDRSWKVAFPLLRPGGRLIYFAGEGLEDPRGHAESISDPQSPTSVVVSRTLATRAPLVMMARG